MSSDRQRTRTVRLFVLGLKLLAFAVVVKLFLLPLAKAFGSAD